MNKVYYNISARKCQEVRTPQILWVPVVIHTYWQWEGFREFAALSRQRSVWHFFPSCNSVYTNINFLSSTALEMLRALTHASHLLIYLKCTAVWKMYTAVILSVKRLIVSSNACIFHTEGRQQTFIYSYRCGCQSKATCLFIKRKSQIFVPDIQKCKLSLLWNKVKWKLDATR